MEENTTEINDQGSFFISDETPQGDGEAQAAPQEEQAPVEAAPSEETPEVDYKAKYEELEKSVRENEPILEFVKRKEVLDAIESILSGGRQGVQGGGQNGQTPAQPSPSPSTVAEEKDWEQLLVSPEMPDDYDPFEAKSDPNSASAKYLQAEKEWRKNVAEYNRMQIRRDKEVREQERIAKEQKDMFEAARDQVVKDFGATQQEAVDFLVAYADEEKQKVILKHAFNAFKAMRTAPKEQSAAKPKVSQERIEALNAINSQPTPGAISPGGQGETEPQFFVRGNLGWL